MTHLLIPVGRFIAIGLLGFAIVNLCLVVKLAIGLDDTYSGKQDLILPILVIGFAFWLAGCGLNATILQRGAGAIPAVQPGE